MDEVYRGLEFDETDRLPAGADALADAGSRSASCRRRTRWPACGSAGSRRTTATCWRGSRRSRTTRRSARRRRRRSWRSSRSGRATASWSARAAIVAANLELVDGFFEDWPRPVHLGPPERRVGRVPAPDRARRRDRRLGGRSRRGRGRAAPAGFRLRLSGQPLPARVRPDGPARGARPPRGVRGEAPLVRMTVPARAARIVIRTAVVRLRRSRRESRVQPMRWAASARYDQRSRLDRRGSASLARQVEERQVDDGRADPAAAALDGPLDREPRPDRLVRRRDRRERDGLLEDRAPAVARRPSDLASAGEDRDRRRDRPSG